MDVAVLRRDHRGHAFAFANAFSDAFTDARAHGHSTPIANAGAEIQQGVEVARLLIADCELRIVDSGITRRMSHKGAKS